MTGDVDSGDDCADTSGSLGAWDTDQADCPGFEAVAEHGSQGDPGGCRRVSLQAHRTAAAEAGSVGGGAGAVVGVSTITNDFNDRLPAAQRTDLLDSPK